jgi:hypothetical protein
MASVGVLVYAEKQGFAAFNGHIMFLRALVTSRLDPARMGVRDVPVDRMKSKSLAMLVVRHILAGPGAQAVAYYYGTMGWAADED